MPPSGSGPEQTPEAGGATSGRLIEEHGLGIVMLVVLLVAAWLAGEVGWWPRRSSSGSRGWLIEVCAATWGGFFGLRRKALSFRWFVAVEPPPEKSTC